MPEDLIERDWDTLLTNIRAHQCLPFLGAGASAPTLPLGGELALALSKKHGYPLEDTGDLARVAQFIAVDRGVSNFPHRLVADMINGINPPDFKGDKDPHGVLADLPLPLYVTTNYDDFMVRALATRNRQAYQEVCQWNNEIREKVRGKSAFDQASGWDPQPENPVVFHLHGHAKMLDSMVLTEDDYFDFLVNIGDSNLLPPKIQEALTRWSLLFLGYSLRDWSFRVIHRALIAQRRRPLHTFNITVQLGHNEDTDEVRAYLAKYYAWMNVRVYWGTASEFVQELSRQWERFRVHAT